MKISLKKTNSLGFSREPKDTKVVVAMSGGVDSSTVAGLMRKEGYDVTGITLKLYDNAKSSKKKQTMLCWTRYFRCKKSFPKIKYRSQNIILPKKI